MGSPKKELKKIFAAAEEQGWRVGDTKDGWQLFAPDGENIVTVHGTPSDHRALANTVSRMRQYGFKWKGR